MWLQPHPGQTLMAVTTLDDFRLSFQLRVLSFGSATAHLLGIGNDPSQRYPSVFITRRGQMRVMYTGNSGQVTVTMDGRLRTGQTYNIVVRIVSRSSGSKSPHVSFARNSGVPITKGSGRSRYEVAAMSAAGGTSSGSVIG